MVRWSWDAACRRSSQRTSAQAARWCSRRCRTSRSTPGAPRSTHPTELYDGLPDGYGLTTDALVHAWARESAHDLRRLLAASLHDNSIDDALDEYAAGRTVVGVMGGHALRRDDPAYRDAALLGHQAAPRTA